MKSIKVMDTAMLIKGFLLDVTNIGSLLPTTENVERYYFLNQNKYFHLGCLTIGLGIAFAHFVRYKIKWAKKLSIKNITKFLNRRKDVFSIQRLEKKDTDTFMLRIFMNGFGLILLPAQAKVSFFLLNLSSIFAVVQLFYKSYINEQYHVTSMLRFSGGLFSFIALSEACIFNKK